jgi:ketosteroid isomerase-like protein
MTKIGAARRHIGFAVDFDHGRSVAPSRSLQAVPGFRPLQSPRETEMPTDREILEALNRDYIDSVQNSDVRRFEQILADEFYCSNPDGSLVDRPGFLRQTAPKVSISGLTASDVMIRIVGDVAIIHARTSYTTADGRAGYGRYTDVWARRAGTWLAVSAHVTRC